MRNMMNFLKTRKQEISGVAVFILVILAAGYVETDFVKSLLCIGGIALAKRIGHLEEVHIN